MREDADKLSWMIVAAALVAALPGAAWAQGADPFRRCAACHQIGPGAKNGVGPQLTCIAGREAGTVEGFTYHFPNGVKESGIIWTDEALIALLTSGQGVTATLRMADKHVVSDPQIRLELLAYIKSQCGH